MRLAACTLLLLGLLMSPAWGYERDKTDAITLRNGTYLVGDIVSLEFGILTLKTDNMGTLSIEWPAVRTLQSKFAFAVERNNGSKYYGAIKTSADGSELEVAAEEGGTTMPIGDVERISRYSPRFWDRINGAASAGFSYSKSSAIQVSSFTFDSNYRSEKIDGQLSFSSNTSKDSSGTTTNRDLLSGAIMFLQQSRNFWSLLGSLERDQSLGIDARLTAGAAVGRRFLQTSFTEVTGIVGVVGAQEWIVAEPGSKSSLESIVGGSWQVFKFIEPKTRLDFSLYAFPSLTESGRLRSTGALSLSHKFPGDFTLALTGYLSYDNRPPEPGAETTDYGMSLNLGYSFGQ